MKKILLLVVAVVALAFGFIDEQDLSIFSRSSVDQSSGSTLQAAYNNKQNDLQVRGQGVVARVLSDDLDGSRHQRFILKIDTDLSLLVAHNIDLAPRISNLKKGDSVEFYGEYEWNEKGGVIHWSHHDPNNRHAGGWLKHAGNTYQ